MSVSPRSLPPIGSRVTVPCGSGTQQAVVDSYNAAGRVRVRVWNARAKRFFATLRTVEPGACSAPSSVRLPSPARSS